MDIILNLSDLLKQKGYIKIPFKISKTNHLLVNGQINGIKGLFILDTGASNSCIDFSDIDFFKLTAEESEHLATGAGSNEMTTKVSYNNKLQLNAWTFNEQMIIAMDLSHVNHALKIHKAKPIKGILGADVLLKGEAFIDYAHCFLYLKRV